MNRRLWIFLAAVAAVAAVAAAVIAVLLFPAIPQNEAYHNFADQRPLLGIANCLNVISNAPFLFIGLAGMRLFLRGTRAGENLLLDARERWPWFPFFVGVALTAFGSAWYHHRPDDHMLVWDRIPMTIGFMSLVAAVAAERVNVQAGMRLLLPLIALGIGSVIYWEMTQDRGHGDLRPYALAQFGSLLVLVLLIALFPARYTRSLDFVVALAFYGVAKLFEAGDKLVFAAGHIASGHTIKHLFAALSTYWIFRMLRLRTPIGTYSARP